MGMRCTYGHLHEREFCVRVIIEKGVAGGKKKQKNISISLITSERCVAVWQRLQCAEKLEKRRGIDDFSFSEG